MGKVVQFKKVKKTQYNPPPWTHDWRGHSETEIKIMFIGSIIIGISLLTLPLWAPLVK